MIFEATHITRSGEEFPVEINSAVIEIGGRHVELSVARDITERKLAEKELLETEKNLRITLNSIGDAVIATDTEGKITRMNPVAERLTGCTLDEARGKVLTDVFTIVNAQTGEPALNPVTMVLKDGEIVGLANHTKLISKDGSEYQIADSGAPIKDADGNITGVVLVFRDVTEEYRMREELRISEETYRNLFQNAQVGLFRTRIENGKILECNEQLAQMFGYDNREDLIAEYITSENYVDPGTREKMLELIRDKGYVANFEARFYRRDRSIFWASYSARVYPERGWIEGVAEDITERRKTLDALQESEARFRNIVESAPIGMHFYSLEDDGRLVFKGSNRAADLILGVEHSQFIGKTIEVAFPPLADTEVPEQYRKVAHDGGVWETEQIQYDDDLITGAFHVRAFQVEKGRMVAMFSDITSRKQAEERLKESEAKLCTVIEKSNDAIYILYNDRFDLINPRFTEITGITFEEAQSPDFYFMDVLTPESKELVEKRGRMWERGNNHPVCMSFH